MNLRVTRVDDHYLITHSKPGKGWKDLSVYPDGETCDGDSGERVSLFEYLETVAKREEGEE